MAEEEQKTLDPTPKKLEDARKRGDVPSAPEMRHAAMFAAMLLSVGALGAAAITRLAAQAAALWGQAGDTALTGGSAQRLAATLLGGMLVAVGPLLAMTIGAALLGTLIQGRACSSLASSSSNGIGCRSWPGQSACSANRRGSSSARRW